MEQKRTSALYRIIKRLVRLVYPKTAVAGAENLPPDEPVIVVGNHCQVHGPIVCELYFPMPRYTWCIGEMMHLKEVPAYAYRDFWSEKPKAVRWLYRLASYLIAPLSVLVFNNANCIGVYHDTRVMGTFRESVQRMQEGNSIVIFPEHNAPYNHILCDFQDRFIDLAKLYYRKTKREAAFVPMYVAPELKTVYLGRPIRFRADAPLAEERERICAYLKEEITAIACGLPRHTVVPYRNIAKRDYPTNRPEEVRP